MCYKIDCNTNVTLYYVGVSGGFKIKREGGRGVISHEKKKKKRRLRRRGIGRGEGEEGENMRRGGEKRREGGGEIGGRRGEG